MIDLRGKTALVTGGAKRVGRAIGLLLADQGVHVAFTYLRSAGEAESTRKELEERGVKAAGIRADLTAPEDCERVAVEAARLTGRVDILVNNASEFPRTPLAELAADPASFDRLFRAQTDIHVRAPLRLGLVLGLEMKRNGWGRIVNITDRVVARGQAYSNWAIYLTTKYGLYGVTQVLAQELAPEVAVNSIAPGLVIPPPLFSAEEVKKLVDKIPLKREVGPAEIAEDVLYLVRSSSKTGSIVLSDGGSGLRTF